MTKALLYLCLVILLASPSLQRKRKLPKYVIRTGGDLNKYYTYTRDHPRKPVEVYDTVGSAVVFRNYRPKTVIIIHDIEESAFDTMNPTLKDAFLTNEDVAVIVVDWSNVASQSYGNVVDAVPSIGEGIASLITKLGGLSKVRFGKIHIVGLGIGAHIAGFAARKTNRVIARITGLTPPPSLGSMTDLLRASDAAYVEIIHTAIEVQLGDTSGIEKVFGHVDFFPDLGGLPPGCEHLKCSHDRAWLLLAASLTHNRLVGHKCDVQDEVYKYNNLTCTGYTLHMGNNELAKYGSGVYYLKTGPMYPYDEEKTCLNKKDPSNHDSEELSNSSTG